MITIYAKNGTARCNARKITLSEDFMAVAKMVVEVSSPEPIAFAIDDYIDYSYNSRRYVLKDLAKVKKQARRNTYGNAFVYTCTFYEQTWELENCPFLDLVPAQQTAVYSSLPDVVVYAKPQNIVERVQANLDSFYGENEWEVLIPSYITDPTVLELLDTYKDITLNNVSCKAALDEIYKQWGLAWIFVTAYGRKQIYVAFSADISNLFKYGKDQGLRAITIEQKDTASLATRIYPYGSTENLPARWYNEHPLDDETKYIDEYQYIPNLMLPPSLWHGGTPDGNYVEDAEAIAKYGLRPRAIYFEGGEYEKIMPSISGLTAKDIRDAKAEIGDTQNVPSTTFYPNATRMDRTLTGDSTTDNGVKPADSGSSDDTETFTFTADSKQISIVNSENGGPVTSFSGDEATYVEKMFFPLDTVTLSKIAQYIISFTDGEVSLSLDSSATSLLDRFSLTPLICAYSPNISTEVEIIAEGTPLAMPSNNSSAWSVDESLSTLFADAEAILKVYQSQMDALPFTAQLYLGFIIDYKFATAAETTYEIPVTINLSAGGGESVRGVTQIANRFTVKIKQIGFDIMSCKKAANENRQLNMKSGLCAGYAFNILSSHYNASDDSWTLTCYRTTDTDLKIAFPNTDRHIAAEDEFVLTGIEMPDIYVYAAMEKLYEQALATLNELKNPKMVYAPDIDNQKMAASPQVLHAGMLLQTEDTDLDLPALLPVDSLQITEDGEKLREFSVTLRNEKADSLLRQIVTISHTEQGVSQKQVSTAINQALNNYSYDQESMEGSGGVIGTVAFQTQGSGNAVTEIVQSTPGLYYAKKDKTFVDLISEQTITGKKYIGSLLISELLGVPTNAPVPDTADASRTFLWVNPTGNYSETPSGGGGGGTGSIYPLTVTVNGDTPVVYDPSVEPKSISLTIPVVESITYSQLKTKRNNGTLVGGQYYRITDYVATTTDSQSRSAGHQFDILVYAKDAATLSEEGSACLHSGDVYFANTNFRAWKVWYCLDNDTSRFSWADTTNGKGVIYRLIDEWGNDVPYDFKNIQFKRYKVTAKTANPELAVLNGLYIGLRSTNSGGNRGLDIDTSDYKWYYTFSMLGSDWSTDATDASIAGTYANNNSFGPTLYTTRGLNNIVFANGPIVKTYLETYGTPPDYTNIVCDDFHCGERANDLMCLGLNGVVYTDIGFRFNIIVGKFRHNSLKTDCQDNTIVCFNDNAFNNFGDAFCENVIVLTGQFMGNNFGYSFRGNLVVGNEFYHNAFDGRTNLNTFKFTGASIYRNNFGVTFCTNTILCGLLNNTFGSDFEENTIGVAGSETQIVQSNVFGVYIKGNFFGNNFNFNRLSGQLRYNSFGAYTVQCVFDPIIEYVDIADGTSSAIFSNVHVCGNIRGTSSAHLTLESSEFRYSGVSGVKRYVTIEGDTDGKLIATWYNGEKRTGIYKATSATTWTALPSDTDWSSITNTPVTLSGYGITDATPKVEAIPYIVGPNTDTTAGTWTGTYSGITSYTEGLTIIYVPAVAGKSGATYLNINGLGKVQCFYTGTSAMGTNYGVGTPILLTYRTQSGTAGWRRADYNADTVNARGLQSYYERGKLYSASAPLFRYKICGYHDGMIVPVVITNQEEATQVNKVPTDIALDTRRGLVYYSGTATVNTAGGAIGANTLHESYQMTTAAYTFNVSVSTYTDVYLQGSYDASTGMFTLDATQTSGNYRSYYALAPKGNTYYSVFTTGKYYWFVGAAYSSANYLQLKVENPVYYFNGTQLVPVEAMPKWGDIQNKPTFGTAAAKDYTTSITQNSTDLPTSGAVYSAIGAAVTSALYFRGISTTPLTDGGTETATIGGTALVAQSGDVVIYNGFEFLWENNVWNKLGDDTSYALKTVTIGIDTTDTNSGAYSASSSYLEGGGDLTAPRLFRLKATTKASLAKADSALQSGDMKILTLVVGTTTIQADYNALTAKTYTINKTAIKDTLESDNGYYLPLSAGSGKALTGTLYSQTILPNGNAYDLGSSSSKFQHLYLSGDAQIGSDTYIGGALSVTNGIEGASLYSFGDTTIEGGLEVDQEAELYDAKITHNLAIPSAAPTATTSGLCYLWYDTTGNYSETPSGGGGTGDIYALTITIDGGTPIVYDPSVEAKSISVTNHSHSNKSVLDGITSTLVNNWSTAYTNSHTHSNKSVLDDISSTKTGNWDSAYTNSHTHSNKSVLDGIASTDITAWNGKYAKPSGGIPKTDLASAVQTTLSNADTAYGWGNHASAGYLTSSSLDGYVNEIATGTGDYISGVSKSGKKLTFTYGTLPTTIAWTNVTGRPTALSDLTNDIISDWALASSKPTYTLDEVADGSTRKLADYVSKVTSTDNAVARFDGTAGQLQNSLVTIDDSGNIFFPIATSTSFSANAKIVLGNAWFGSNPTGGLAYGTRDGSTYTSKYCFEGIQFRPVSTADNQINIGTTSYRWKNIYLAGTIGNGTYALTLPSKSGTIAVTSDLNSYLPLAGGTMSNTNLVTNLNAEYLGGYKKQHYIPATIHNPSNGVLVTTDIDATSNTMIYVRIEGNSYSTSRSPMFTIAQAYCYNRGTAFAGVSALNIGYIEPDVIYFLVKSGYVCLWWSQGSSATRGFLVTVWTTYPDANRVVNRVSSITNTALPEDETVTLSKSVVPARTIRGVDSTDNAIARFNGEAGEIQNSGVLIDDSDNLSLPLGSSSSFSANPKLIIGNAWLGTNTAGALSYGIISGSAYNSYFAFEGTGLRPANSSSAGDNKLNIGTSTVRFKDAYFGGTINTAGADISDSLSIPTDAPSSTTSGKIYLYASSTGSYAVEPWYGFNQLISNGNMESTTGWGTVYSGYTRTVENNVLTLTITSATYRPQVRTALSVANGHWVYYTYTMKYTTSAAYSDVKTAFLYPTPLYIPTGNQKDADYYNWKKTSGIVKVNAAKTYLYIGRTASSSHTFAVGDTVQIKNVMVCDLTEMFGDENIPTVAQFEAMYPQDYYEYTPIGG